MKFFVIYTIGKYILQLIGKNEIGLIKNIPKAGFGCVHTKNHIDLERILFILYDVHRVPLILLSIHKVLVSIG